MFNGCVAFNQDLEDWDVSGVTDMSYMFKNCVQFNQDLEDWDTDSVEEGKMEEMFEGCGALDERPSWLE
nr:BspA family leucine-rich repeat surface protein [Helicobacter heilmannii]